MKILKILLSLLLILAVAGFIAIKLFSESEPDGQTGSEADQLAQTIMTNLNKEAFDAIPYLQWEFFRPGQKYLWDKKNNKAIIEWSDNKVIFDLDAYNAKCFMDGQPAPADKIEELKSKAWSNWCNDSFWMIAPYKLFDPGTSREVVNLDDGRKGLKVTYQSGGVTPGDIYLWEIDSNNRPTGYKMWTSIIPIKGMYSSWGGWENHMGAILSTKHSLLGKEVSMKNIKAGNNWSDFGFTSDPFK